MLVTAASASQNLTDELPAHSIVRTRRGACARPQTVQYASRQKHANKRPRADTGRFLTMRPGGVLLVIGGAGLAWLKTKADPELGAPALWGGEMAFVLLLVFVGATGLLLYAATGTGAVGWLLAVHLGSVLAFFLLTPYSKMIHGFYRMAALTRDAQLKSGPQA